MAPEDYRNALLALLNVEGKVLSLVNFSIVLATARDMRILVIPSEFPPPPLVAPAPIDFVRPIVMDAMELLGARLPVRDGVQEGTFDRDGVTLVCPSRCAGIRYYYGPRYPPISKGVIGDSDNPNYVDRNIASVEAFAQTLHARSDSLNRQGFETDRIDVVLNYVRLTSPELDQKKFSLKGGNTIFSDFEKNRKEVETPYVWVACADPTVASFIIIHEMGHATGLVSQYSPYAFGYHDAWDRGDKAPVAVSDSCFAVYAAKRWRCLPAPAFEVRRDAS